MGRDVVRRRRPVGVGDDVDRIRVKVGGGFEELSQGSRGFDVSGVGGEGSVESVQDEVDLSLVAVRAWRGDGGYGGEWKSVGRWERIKCLCFEHWTGLYKTHLRCIYDAFKIHLRCIR